MSEQIRFIKEILDYVESYREDVGNTDIKEFTLYLRDKVLTGDERLQGENFSKEDYMKHREMPKVEFSSLLTGLYRFARHYVKKAFVNTTIRTIEEFGFLATLLKEKSLLKNELIKMHYMEVSSGSEILKRLIKSNLIYEYPDAKDGRAKRVSLTEEGFKEIMSAFDEMHKVSEIVTGNLTGEELKEALVILNKLQYFHVHIHEASKEDSLNEIYQKYILQEENS
jgi:DNA-binding MarR family transcriptional regulator